jgi:cysteine desulfurase family protein
MSFSMNFNQNIYLDNAATGFPRPAIVTDSVSCWMLEEGGSPGRGHHFLSRRAGDQVSKIRRQVARFFGVNEEFRVAFTFGATDALNMAIKGILRKDDHVIISGMEHNSVLRPLRHLEAEGLISIDVISCNEEGYLVENLIWEAFHEKTKLIVINHASNVTGSIQAVAEIGAEIRRRGAYLLLDAAQSTGNIPIKIGELNADMIVFAGHKGLFALPGVGGMIIGERINQLNTWRQGGTGYNSKSETQPLNWPEAFEAGTMNMPGIISLGKGIEYIEEQGLEAIASQKMAHLKYLWDTLSEIEGIKLYGPNPEKPRVAVLSLNITDWEPDDVAEILQHNYKVQVRSGLHCAPLAHNTLGTMPNGSVRISPGYFTKQEDLDTVVQAIKNMALSRVGWNLFNEAPAN